MTTPVLGGVTLPEPSEYRAKVGYRGAGRVMADGSVAYDLISTTAKSEWTLTWPALTTAQRATVASAFDTVKNSSAAFTSLEGTSTNVTRLPEQDTIEFEAVQTRNGPRWRCTLVLREV